MADYLIHACPQRLWYVENFLIPSMLKQGIKKENIEVYTDLENRGNLEAFVHSLSMIKQTDENSGRWHLQDDVVISKQFRRWTEEYDDGLVCGFCNCYSEKFPLGIVKPKDMWFSFQCMRITDSIAKEFAAWFYKEQEQNREYAGWAKQFYDDYVFHVYMEQHYPLANVLNLTPNVVDHVDYLINGSIINKQRGDLNVRSIYWYDNDSINELEAQLERRRNASS